MAADLRASAVGGWTIQEYLGSGKSAVVVRAERNGLDAALKIFDPELVERFGHTSQLGRISREVTLVGHGHPHLVEIIDGGQCSVTAHLYVAMELVTAPILSHVLRDVPRSMIGTLMAQLASAAEFLEQRELAHRDIKPDNIAVSSDFSSCKLLDLGVLRPLSGSDVTDSPSQSPFIGTLRYSSPEFLFREEEDTTEGWRSITFYQLGAVLHDLIMSKPLFAEFSEPYARLVQAVKHEEPLIHTIDVSPDLVLLAQNCLVKNPRLRLSLVGWSDFQQVRSPRSDTSIAKERILKRRAMMTDSGADSRQENWHAALFINQVADSLGNTLRISCVSSSLFPPLQLNVIGSSDPTSRMINLCFPRSARFLLPRGLTFVFRLTLLDAESRAVEIRVAAALSASNHDPTDKEAVMYKGVYSEEQVTPMLEAILVRCLDRAQQLTSSDEAESEPRWLTIEEEASGNG